MPFLTDISFSNPGIDAYPFNVPAFKNGLRLSLNSNVTFFVGENGSGKSTLIEAVAEKTGFNLRGGNKNHNLNTGVNFNGYQNPLTKPLHLTWKPAKISNGFFMRAESFFNFADYIDELAKENSRIYQAYGGKSLHEQSHGESFLALFYNQFDSGIYILDEPEAALSPARILAFMSIINNLCNSGRAQFLIATHSPILICYPNADIFSFEKDEIKQVSYSETEHYSLTKQFLENPEAYFRYLF